MGITSQDQLTIVENEKKRKYDVLANEMGAMHKCKTRIIPYVLTWDGIVTKFHKSYAKEIGLTTKIQSYIQFIVLKKTLESISYDYRRGGEEITEESVENVVLTGARDCNLTEVKASVPVATDDPATLPPQDLVLVTLKAHAVPAAAASIARLLAPGGVLLMLEVVRPSRWVDLSFGFTEGWWAFADDFRATYPLLPADAWQQVLDSVGFDEIVVALGSAGSGDGLEEQALLLARKRSE